METGEQAEIGTERREFSRISVPLLGRLMLSDRSEYDCRVVDVSTGSVCLTTGAMGRVGERVIAYIELIGRLEGRIARITPGGFAMELNTPLTKKQKLARQLCWIADKYQEIA